MKFISQHEPSCDKFDNTHLTMTVLTLTLTYHDVFVQKFFDNNVKGTDRYNVCVVVLTVTLLLYVALYIDLMRLRLLKRIGFCFLLSNAFSFSD